MALPDNYLERVYAGVLGKIIGVYLGRPFEGWTYDQIMDRLGEITYYVHDRMNVPLIVTDDDISGTMTFVRALEDYGYDRKLTPAQIGHTWLNYLIEKRTILWWGGMGNSTEHTAYLRLKNGVEAPCSGSIALNGKVVAEQIGAQIFIDGWAMVAPGDPERAADFARRAASVSHDGEAIYGAQMLAAMEAQAFIQPDINTLIDTGLSMIPNDSIIYTMIEDIREWHATGSDWRKARLLLDERYGYHIYGGNCHIVPNHGLIILSLLYGDDDFQKTQMIVNTSGWDTDCNAGNVGCLMGIKNGLVGLSSGPDWRGLVADRLYLPTADGGRAITDAATEAIRLANTGRALHGLEPISPKNGAKFYFELPGSVQGFVCNEPNATQGNVSIENVAGYSESGNRALAIRYTGLAEGQSAQIETATFTPSLAMSNYFDQGSYPLLASPTLYSGQTIIARLIAASENSDPACVGLYIKHYDNHDALEIISGDKFTLNPGESTVIKWQVPDTGGQPIALVGVQISGNQQSNGTVYLDYMTWDGTPNITLKRPDEHKRSKMWKKAWVNGLDAKPRLIETDNWPEPFRLIQNVGRGLLMHGTRDWVDYQVMVSMTPHLCRAGGLAIRVQGMQRYYAMLLDHDSIRLVVAFEGKDTVLASVPRGWQLGTTYTLTIKVEGNRLSGYVDSDLVIQAQDPDHRFKGGGIALIAEEGRIGCDVVSVRPL